MLPVLSPVNKIWNLNRQTSVIIVYLLHFYMCKGRNEEGAYMVHLYTRSRKTYFGIRETVKLYQLKKEIKSQKINEKQETSITVQTYSLQSPTYVASSSASKNVQLLTQRKAASEGKRDRFSELSSISHLQTDVN